MTGKRLDDLGAEVQFGLVENFNREITRQQPHNVRGVRRGELVENFDGVGGVLADQGRGQNSRLESAFPRCVGISHSSPSGSAGNGRVGELERSRPLGPLSAKYVDCRLA